MNLSMMRDEHIHVNVNKDPLKAVLSFQEVLRDHLPIG
jgi:hypothetical protein